MLMVIGSMVSCGQPATTGGFDSPVPSARLHALGEAARTGDRSDIKRIVELLDSDDAAVRLLAISTLERLTGETFGYRHYDLRWEREDSIQRWVNAIREDTFRDLESVPTQVVPGVRENG